MLLLTLKKARWGIFKILAVPAAYGLCPPNGRILEEVRRGYNTHRKTCAIRQKNGLLTFIYFNVIGVECT